MEINDIKLKNSIEAWSELEFKEYFRLSRRIVYELIGNYIIN